MLDRVEILHKICEVMSFDHKTVWGVISGILCFLIGVPTAALYAVGVMMILDIVTKLRALCGNNGGWYNATKTKKIRSRALINGVVNKLVAYFIILSIAQMSKHIVSYDVVQQAISSVVYAIIFFAEALSVFENMLEAEEDGSSNIKILNMLLLKFKRETAKIIGDDIIASANTTTPTDPIDTDTSKRTI